MQLKEQYKTAQLVELYRSKYAFDPDEHTFFTDDPENFIFPSGFEEWELKKIDFKAYGNERLIELGITPEKNTIELFGGPDVPDNKALDQEIFSINKQGDIEILQYQLNRKVYVKDKTDKLSKQRKATKQEIQQRYVFHRRLHPWHEHICEGKYDFSQGTARPFWSPELIEHFEAKTKLDYLVITEGQFKARKACLEGIPTVGLTSISHFKKSGEIHAEIIEFIHACQVKKLIILWDGDCRDISTKSLDEGDDISKRPALFFNFAVKIKELVHRIILHKNIHIYFATIQSSEIDGEPKGIDDLLCVVNPEDVKADFGKIGRIPGTTITWFSFQNEIEIKRVRKWYHLFSENDFYQAHSEKIGEKSFVFFGSTYKVENGRPIIQVSAKIKEYKRIGPDYFRLVKDGVYDEDGELVRTETTLMPWKVGEIQRDHGKDVTKHIERYDGFTNVASHVNYQQVVDNKWNLYNDISHEVTPGSWPNIRSLIKHIFQDQYEMALDYLQLLYTKPYQKLPVLCLVSKDEGTGKSTFMQLLQMIFQNNMALVSSEDIMGSWTSHWVSKLIVGSEETFFEKKEALEKIKNLSTADSVMRAERFVNNKMIPCILKFVFCSNHEDDFIKLNANSTRFWVIKVKKIPADSKNTEMKSKMQNEVTHFLHFLLNRELDSKKQDRMWFGLEQIITDAFQNVVMNSEPGHIKELRLKLQDYFLKWGTSTVELTAENIREYFGIRGENNWLNKIIRQYLNVTRKTNSKGEEYVATYSFYTNDPVDKTKSIEVKDKGRPFVFHRADFVPTGSEQISLQTAMVLDEPGMKRYKFRAECSKDAMQFFIEIGDAAKNFKIQNMGNIPDVEVEFDSELSLSEIIDEMKALDDSHVMAETVQSIEKYTGERDFNDPETENPF